MRCYHKRFEIHYLKQGQMCTRDVLQTSWEKKTLWGFLNDKALLTLFYVHDMKYINADNQLTHLSWLISLHLLHILYMMISCQYIGTWISSFMSCLLSTLASSIIFFKTLYEEKHFWLLLFACVCILQKRRRFHKNEILNNLWACLYNRNLFLVCIVPDLF